MHQVRGRVQFIVNRSMEPDYVSEQFLTIILKGNIKLFEDSPTLRIGIVPNAGEEWRPRLSTINLLKLLF